MKSKNIFIISAIIFMNICCSPKLNDFVIDKNHKAGDIEKIIRDVDKNLIKKVQIFDVFEGGNMPDGKKSIEINITIKSMDKTLSEKDINEVSQKIINTVKEKTGATLRS